MRLIRGSCVSELAHGEKVIDDHLAVSMLMRGVMTAKSADCFNRGGRREVIIYQARSLATCSLLAASGVRR